MRKPTCETCRFWHRRDCRRYPAPRATISDHWCGEHSPANQDQPQPELEPVADPVDGVDFVRQLYRKVLTAGGWHGPLDSYQSAAEQGRAIEALHTGIAAMTKAVPDDEVPEVTRHRYFMGRTIPEMLRANGLQITCIPGWVK